MTPSPKEKAKELVDMFVDYADDKGGSITIGYNNAKKIALIAVNLVISTIPTKPSKTETERLDAIMYWLEVKQELEKL